MILPPRKLNHIESYRFDKEVKIVEGYTKYYYDSITINYYKETQGLFGVKKKAWNEKHKFYRTSAPHKKKDAWTTFSMDSEIIELQQQIDLHLNGSTKVISNDNYEFFMEQFPERFI